MPGFNADLYQKYHKIWPTGFAKVAVQSVQAVLLPLSNNSRFTVKRGGCEKSPMKKNAFR
jgi:hypothetical protein